MLICSESVIFIFDLACYFFPQFSFIVSRVFVSTVIVSTVSQSSNLICSIFVMRKPYTISPMVSPKGPFKIQAKNGTDPLKSGTVPINFVRKYPNYSGYIGAYGPRRARVFPYKIYGYTIPLFNGSVPFFACSVNGP